MTAEPVRRASEIEDYSNLYFIHPIAHRLTLLFDRLGFTPNLVSLLGLASGVAAGWCYHRFQAPGWALSGFLLMLAWHVFDGADGQLARLQNAQSEFGKIIDGICDYVTFSSVYIGLATTLALHYGTRIWGLVVTAGVFHILQAATYEVQRQEYGYWGLGRTSAELPDLAVVQARLRAAHGPGKLLEGLYLVYVWIQHRVAGGAHALRGRLRSALGWPSPRVALLRAEYRAIFAPSVRRWALMSSNYRTLALFIAALAGRPAYYFVYEIVGLSVIALALMSRQGDRYRRLSAALDRLEAQNA